MWIIHNKSGNAARLYTLKGLLWPQAKSKCCKSQELHQKFCCYLISQFNPKVTSLSTSLFQFRILRVYEISNLNKNDWNIQSTEKLCLSYPSMLHSSLGGWRAFDSRSLTLGRDVVMLRLLPSCSKQNKLKKGCVKHFTSQIINVSEASRREMHLDLYGNRLVFQQYFNTKSEKLTF